MNETEDSFYGRELTNRMSSPRFCCGSKDPRLTVTAYIPKQYKLLEEQFKGKDQRTASNSILASFGETQAQTETQKFNINENVALSAYESKTNSVTASFPVNPSSSVPLISSKIGNGDVGSHNVNANVSSVPVSVSPSMKDIQRGLRPGRIYNVEELETLLKL